MAPVIHRYTTLSSTNKKGFELALDGAAHGEIVIAENQSSGRGRLGKSWVSPPGKGLSFSIILRPNLPTIDYPKITMTAGVGVAHALASLTGLKVQLKWPNDIYIHGKKCCGILTEASFEKGENSPFAIVGIGINIFNEPSDFPAELQDRGTSLFMETGRRFLFEDVLEKVVAEVNCSLSVLVEEGFSAILSEWKKRDYLVGKRLEWLTNSGEIIVGVSLGSDEHGQLLVKDDVGGIHQVISGDVSLAQPKSP